MRRRPRASRNSNFLSCDSVSRCKTTSTGPKHFSRTCGEVLWLLLLSLLVMGALVILKAALRQKSRSLHGRGTRLVCLGFRALHEVDFDNATSEGISTVATLDICSATIAGFEKIGARDSLIGKQSCARWCQIPYIVERGPRCGRPDADLCLLITRKIIDRDPGWRVHSW